MKKTIQKKKITDTDQGNQLSNIKKQTFKSDLAIYDGLLTSKSTQLPTNYSELFKPDNSKLVQLTEQMIQTNEVKTPLAFAKKFMFTFDSKEPFPINIDVLIEMKVYDLVGNIKKKLIKNFNLDTEYKVQKATPEYSGVAKKGGTGSKENIMLTVDCFKSMCMLANSEAGKQVKNYYLDLEKIFKRYIMIEFEEKQLEVDQKQLELKQSQLKFQTLNNKITQIYIV